MQYKLRGSRMFGKNKNVSTKALNVKNYELMRGFPPGTIFTMQRKVDHGDITVWKVYEDETCHLVSHKGSAIWMSLASVMMNTDAKPQVISVPREMFPQDLNIEDVEEALHEDEDVKDALKFSSAPEVTKMAFLEFLNKYSLNNTKKENVTNE